MKQLILISFLSLITAISPLFSQYTNVDFEPGGQGASWTWIMDSNDDNPPLEFVANPATGGINTSATTAKFTARLNGAPWALTFTDGLDGFQFDMTNTTVKIMVNKPTISNVGMKFEGPNGAIELVQANTVTGQWEELTYDFSTQIGNTYTRMVIIPDFDFGPRAQENIVYFDNIQIPMGNVMPDPEPMIAAPTPTHDEVADNVLSVFSDAYSDIPGTDFDPDWGQPTDATIEMVAGNPTLRYLNLTYQGTQFASPTGHDVSGHGYIHIDFWTTNATALDFYLISQTTGERKYDFTITNDEWVSVDIPLHVFTSQGLGITDIHQFKVTGNGTIWFDNWYFHGTYFEPEPMTAAPDPIHDEVTDNVISIFSDSYTNVSGTDFDPFWGQQTDATIIDINGNNTLKYANLNYQGTQFGSNQDVSDNEFLHVDFWTADASFIDFYLISPGPNEVAYSLPVTPNQWNSVDIPLSAFNPPVNLSDVFQFKVEGTGTVYFDNFYFHGGEESTGVDIELCVDFSCAVSAPAAPSVMGSFNGECANCDFLTDADGDGVYCATVNLEPGTYEYRFFTQGDGPESFDAPGTCTNAAGTRREITVVENTPQTLVFGWESCEEDCIPEPSADIELCVDMNCLPGVQAPSVFGTFNGWNAGANPVSDPDGDGIYCTTVTMTEGANFYKFFDQLQGPENFNSVTAGCTGLNGPFVDREITVVADVPQTLTFGWNTCDPTCPRPTMGAPIPTHDEVDNCVISIFSDTYTNVAGTNLNPFWGQQTVTTEKDIDGNNTLHYFNLNYQGTQFGSNQDVSDHDFLHVDFWTADAAFIDFYLISPGNEIAFPLTVVPNQWNSVDIPLSAFDPPVNLSDVFQFKVEGTGTVYFDNYYFWKTGETWYADSDMDGYGNPNSSILTCSPPANYVLDNTDCNDDFANIFPGAVDIPCNGIDEDCSGADYITDEAVVILPSLPSGIACSTADGYSPPDATYNNGEGGIYNVSGTIAGQVTNFWNSCGGYLVVTYPDVIDNCGRTIEGGTFTIDVYAAPIPPIMVPQLPSNVSCDVAQTYSPPSASADNGLAGSCNITGNVLVKVNHFYDACGGNLEVIYYGKDNCGRNLVAEVVMISVDPAPAPSLSLPTYPSELSCGEAEDFIGLYASYENGMGGSCNINGSLEPTVLKTIDACNGGTITITYSGQDDCGNTLSASPITISVAPATLPTIQLPDNMGSISCGEAGSYTPGVATFSNGENGFCENSGELDLVMMEHYWSTCEGGYILYQYAGNDNCGNTLETDILVVSVSPDTWAPQGDCINIVETLDDMKDVPSPSSLSYYLEMMGNNFAEYCSEVVVTVVGDSGDPVCGLDGTFYRTYELEISDDCGNVADVCALTFTGNCNPLYCTMSQDFYSSSTESFGGYTALEMIDVLMASGTDPIEIGMGDCGFTLDDASCVQDALLGEGQSISLSDDYELICGNPSSNNLVNQIITTQLNVRYNAMLNAGGLDFGNFHLGATCMYIPAHISNALPADATVNDLINYANDFIGCQCSGTCGDYQNVMSDLTGLFLGLNSRFNQCHIPGPCFLTNEEEEEVVLFEEKAKEKQAIDSSIENIISNENISYDLGLDKKENRIDLVVYPNPVNDVLNIQIDKANGKVGVVQIFNMQGSKIGERTFDTSHSNLLKWNVDQFSSGMYWLTFNVKGEDQIIKKIIIGK